MSPSWTLPVSAVKVICFPLWYPLWSQIRLLCCHHIFHDKGRVSFKLGELKSRLCLGLGRCDRNRMYLILEEELRVWGCPAAAVQAFFWDQRKQAGGGVEIQRWHTLRLNSSVVSDCNACSLTLWWQNLSQEENQWRSNGRRYSTWLWQFLWVMMSSLSQVNSTYYPTKNGFPSFKGRVPHLSPFLPLCVSLLPITLHSGSLLND